jgi:hypothetical protein
MMRSILGLLLLAASAIPTAANPIVISVVVYNASPDRYSLTWELDDLTDALFRDYLLTVAPGGTTTVTTDELSLTPGSDLTFQLSGAAISSLGTTFPVVAFATGATIPSTPPATNLIDLGDAPIPIDRIFLGNMDFYDGPEVGGTWSLTAMEAPEPATLGLMLIGLGLLMLMARKP